MKKHGEELRKGAKRVEELLEARIKAMENSKTPGALPGPIVARTKASRFKDMICRLSRQVSKEPTDNLVKILRTTWVVAAWV